MTHHVLICLNSVVSCSNLRTSQCFVEVQLSFGNTFEMPSQNNCLPTCKNNLLRSTAATTVYSNYPVKGLSAFVAHQLLLEIGGCYRILCILPMCWL